MSQPIPRDMRDLQRRILHGSLWLIGFRWTIRLTGLASTVILARLLTPADYGVVAIAMLIVGAIETFSNTGQHWALIRHPNPTREHYDSVWTVSVVLGFFLGALIFAATPLTAAYFHEPRATAVVEILAMRTALLGFQNVGIVDFQRSLRFDQQFRYNVYSTLLSFAATVASALILRNYWALVIGIMTKQIAVVVLSYTMQDYRPRFSLSKVREIWTFSIWTLLKAIGFYLNTQIDKLSIGSFGGAPAMGRYDVAQDVATSPTQELVTPLVTVLFPVMATVQSDVEKRRTLYLSTLYASALICISTSIGIALVSDDLVDLVLGNQWDDLKPLIPWLALSFGTLGLSSSVYSAFDTLGRPRVSAELQWMRVFFLGLVMFPVGYYLRDLQALAITRFVLTILLTPALFFALGKAIGVPPFSFVSTLWRPFIAGLVMAVSVIGVNKLVEFHGTLRLVIDVMLGVTMFFISLMTFWSYSGRPPGPEELVWKKLRDSWTPPFA